MVEAVKQVAKNPLGSEPRLEVHLHQLVARACDPRVKGFGGGGDDR